MLISPQHPLNDLTSIDHMQATSILLSLQFCCPLDTIVTLFIDFIAREWGGQGRDFASNMTKIQKICYFNRISTWFATLDVQHLLSIASEVPRIARVRVYTRLKWDQGRKASDWVETPNPITPKMSAVLLQHHPYVLSMLSLPLCDRPAKAPPPGIHSV